MSSANKYYVAIPGFVKNIIERLSSSGYPAYVVGGAVRDMCLRRSIADWDVVTSAPPDRIKSIFRNIRHFSIKHETITLVDSSGHHEVITFRGSKHEGLSIEEDLGHRDFTINAMAYVPDTGAVLDPYGGERDATQKLIRATGDPADRFREDPIRLLRAVRLATELGFQIEKGTRATISRLAGQLTSVAEERVREELMKILMSLKPSTGFNLMKKTGLLKQVLPELLEGYLKRQNAYHRYTIYKHIMETVDGVEPEPVLRWTALLHDIAKPRVREKVDGIYRFWGHEEASAKLAREIMGRLKFSGEMITRVTHIISHHMIGYETGWGDGAVRRLISRVGPENIGDLFAFRRADLLAHGVEDERLILLSELEGRVEEIMQAPPVIGPHDLAIDGRKVMEILGVPQGPEVGKALKRLLDKVMDQPELNSEEGLVAVLEEMKEG